jgi:hypothetical protein
VQGTELLFDGVDKVLRAKYRRKIFQGKEMLNLLRFFLANKIAIFGKGYIELKTP